MFSESEFFQVFRLNHKQDRKNVEQFIPADLGNRLPEYHSDDDDVGENNHTVLRPVPAIEVIYRSFESRLKRRTRIRMSDTKCQCGKCHTCRHRAAVMRARAARLVMRAVQILKNKVTSLCA